MEHNRRQWNTILTHSLPASHRSCIPRTGTDAKGQKSFFEVRRWHGITSRKISWILDKLTLQRQGDDVDPPTPGNNEKDRG